MSELVNVYMDDIRDCPLVGWIVVRTVEEVQALLAAGRVERLSLDHDMGACPACNAAADKTSDIVLWCGHALDGTKLVWWMIETGHWPHEKPVVHSHNPVGRERMRGMIERYWPERFGREETESANFR